jgi:hypothetical protein
MSEYPTAPLCIKAARKLRKLELPTNWPDTAKERLIYANKTTSEIYPYMHAFAEMWRGRHNLDLSLYKYHPDFRYFADDPLGTLGAKFIAWIKSIPPTPTLDLEIPFFAMYKIESNRVSNIYSFDTSHVNALFPIAKKNDPIPILKQICAWWGGPWTTIQRREVSGKQAWVLGTPTGMANYGN